LTDVPIEINKLVNLESLYLSENKLMVISDLSQLESLRYLSVRSNELNEFPDISNLENLCYLDVSGNKLMVLPEYLYELGDLCHLNLSNNCICDDESMKIFENLQVEEKIIDGQKQQPIMLPMVII